ncbi:Asp-tRNAAsn/Glu-tRNAGln amidotransferase A subunit [Pseudomonas syringae]|uniref:Amidase protein n=1 Tax=Pseudomonas syringae pv. apii TaxID=81036 RepID=A0A3M3N0N6_9PSED|nr:MULTISPECIES: amidase [Pseudomonas syringae group]RMN50714.1 Amidase protein [Pseudomonas syringae pv. apii]RMN53285.1 Amidase protein [Pseudomonas syringae pv. apii]RMN97866.1 Amidase protein [Pseudomonas syringae pv. apii]SDZ20446.1 Asp-tRNAAsn/Glu-tRNAGln amidotransferase A subunit [Pseudomonas syringae]
MQNRSELLSKSATELRALIGNKQISPVELLDACIERIESLNPKINAFAATCFERARDEALLAEHAVLQGKPLGLLHGLPIGIKDLEETAGVLTTYGSQLFRDNIPAQDNLFVARLRAAGAIMVGKTNVPELGAGANTRNVVWGATGNPFNPELNAGGSSGGSAAALAVDMVPLCSGSDTGGSLRIPAALCGVVGLRPSPGLVPSERKKLGWTPISVVGPMGRNVADTLLQLRASAGLAQSDPLSYAIADDQFAPRTVDLSQLRVGYSEDFGTCAVDTAIRAVFREKISALKPLFKSCDAIDLNLTSAHRTFDVLRAEAFVAGLRDAHDRDPDALGPNTRANFEMGAAMSLQDCVKAHGEQSRLFRGFQKQFEHYDLILAPTTPVSPFPWSELYLREVNGVQLDNYYRWLALCYTITLTTNPALSLPCGTDHQGMPFGLQVIGGFRGDAKLLACAEALEQATANDPRLSRPRPDLQKLLASAVDLTHIVTHPPVYGGSKGGKPEVGAM